MEEQLALNDASHAAELQRVRDEAGEAAKAVESDRETEISKLTAEHAAMLEAKATGHEQVMAAAKRKHAEALDAVQAELATAQQGAAAFGAAEVP